MIVPAPGISLDSLPEIKPALKDLAQRINPILRRNTVVRAAVFGSMARGEANPDIAPDIVELEEELGHSVDVLTCRAIHHRLRQRILPEQATIL
ncbi:MAG: DNA polymerase beta [Pseudomonadota bacterium]